MSYPKYLDEYTEEQLLRELQRRSRLQMKGVCDYCGRDRGVKPSCKERDRHFLNEEEE